MRGPLQLSLVEHKICKQMYVRIHTFTYVCAYMYIKRVLELNAGALFVVSSRRYYQRHTLSLSRRTVDQVLGTRLQDLPLTRVQTDVSARALVNYCE